MVILFYYKIILNIVLVIIIKQHYFQIIKEKKRDYHFYKQNKSGYWSHKPGKTKAINLDSKKANPGGDIYWILTIGGVGIGLGLLYGYKIIKALGINLCKITPSRGVCIELASALVIITGSRLEIPLSTTHCHVGATLGVVALENVEICHGINFNIVLKSLVG